MAFVDGENFTIRGQAFAENRSTALRERDAWDPNVFLWFAERSNHLEELVFGLSPDTDFRATRAYYYTSVKGDNDRVFATRERLRRFGFHPAVFKRTKDGRSKAVDISLARDFLSHAHLGNFELALLVAGDGDYVPLVDEAQRRGRVVVVAFFEDFVSSELRLAADYFVDVSDRFADSWRSVLGSGAFQ